MFEGDVYLHDSIFVHNTRSSSMVTLARPPTRSSLKITNRSFRHAAPASLVRHSLLHFLLSHMIMAFHHLHYHRLHLLLLAQYFILNSRLGSSANPFLHRPFSFLSGLITRTLGPSNDFTMLYGCTGKSTPSRFSNALLITTLSFIHSFHSFV